MRITGIYSFFKVTAVILSVAVIAASCEGRQPDRKNAAVRVFRRVSPAVVSIIAVPVPASENNSAYRFPIKSFFRDFFRDFGLDTEFDKEPERNLGSGVIIDPGGHILTNEHVVINAFKVLVQLEDGSEYEAEVIGSDSRFDLAVLKIEAGASLPHLEMGRSDDLMIGESVIAIGNPFGLGHTLTTGVISSLHRTLLQDEREYRDLIQVDACINPGNSGGPLLNIRGELIGITSAIYQKAQGIGFAIPIDRARRVVDDLIRYGETQPGWLGVKVSEIGPDIRASLGYKDEGGLLISEVVADGPAESAKLEAGQILEVMDEAKMSDLEDYIELLRDITVNDTITLQVWDGGKRKRVKIKAAEFPLSLADELIWSQLGIEISPARLTRGVKISRVSPKSRAGRIGLVAGDVILKVNRYWIENAEHFQRVMVKNRRLGSVLLGIQRGNVIYYITLPLSYAG